MIIMVLGNVILVGEKIASVSHIWFAEYIFYCLLIVPFCYYAVFPMLKMLKMPEFPAFDILTAEANNDGIIKVRELLRKNCPDLKDGEKKAYCDRLKDAKEIKKELERRSEASKSKIRGYATTVFITTSISQNGKIDSFIISLMNIRMIYEMIMATGFRPKITELIRIYKNVLSTALFSYITSEALSGIGTLAITDAQDISAATDDMDLLGSLLSKKRVKGIILTSLADGIVNTLLTCRIGYITQKYLEAGPNAFSGKQRKETRKDAIKDSFALTKDIMGDTIKDMKEVTKKKIAEFLNKKENEIVEAIEEKTGSTMENLKSSFDWLDWLKKPKKDESA